MQVERKAEKKGWEPLPLLARNGGGGGETTYYYSYNALDLTLILSIATFFLSFFFNISLRWLFFFISLSIYLMTLH